MKFKNVKVPEGINVSRHSPLADLFILSGGAIVLFGALGLAALLLQLVLGAALGSAPDSLEGLILGPNALLALGFSREAEREADHDALDAVAALYGHTAGAAEVFEVFLEEADKAGAVEPPAFLSTHPLSAERIAEMRVTAREQGWALEGEVTPLPPALARLRTGP